MNQQSIQQDVAIKVRDLSHWYSVGKKKDNQKVEALKNVSFEVKFGEVFGILGPNGGGKTTLFKILSTLLHANSTSQAHAEIDGKSITSQAAAVREALGVVFQSPSLDGKLTAKENLLHNGHLYGLSGPDLDTRVDALLKRFQLIDRQNDLVEQFSGGMKRKIEVAKSILHEPRVLILDEPTTGLDPASRRDLWLTIHELVQKNSMTVALTTHLMEEAEKCDRLAILSKGELVGIGTPSELKGLIGGDVISVVPEDQQHKNSAQELAENIRSNFNGWDDGGEPKIVDGIVRCEHKNGAEMVAKISGAYSTQIKSITVGQPTLEDVFVHLTGDKFSNNHSE
ncbi:ATP-binding cassette domain-containing protein [Planctomycetota bacterium]|nr:ATP-binding cassette domain-containing protein [Planctomycetota bacterium]